MKADFAIDVDTKSLGILQALFAKNTPNLEVWAFGSRVKWTSRPDSDLDIVVFAKTVDMAKVNNLKEDLDESNLPFRVDVLVWDVISDSFRENIKQQYIVLQAVSEWKEVTLGEFCPFIYGKALPERNRVAGKFPVISSAGITGTHNMALVNTSGIVIGRKGTVGSVTLSMKPFWAIDTAFYIIDDPQKRDLFFTYYLLKNLSLSEMNTDSAVPGLNRDNAHALVIKVPPLNIQKQIASILGALDDRIALLRETNDTLEAIAQALFKSWFVDFDPVHANAGAQAPSLPPEIQALFPATFTETAQGLVPEGWSVSGLNEICQIASGKRPEIRSDVECEGAQVPLYGGAGVMGYTDKSLFDEKKILTGRVGTLGKVHIATPPFWASDNVLVLTPKDQSNFYFSLNWLLAIDVHLLNRGSTQPLLTQKDLGAQQRALPPNEIHIEFECVVAELYLKIQANSQQAQTLATLRDTLLPRLISGQLRLPEAEVALAEVL